MDSEGRPRRPLVIDIKGNSRDDGPGIRSVVFLKGCQLDCAWCQNPESKKVHAELSYDKEKCVGSQECVKACPEGALTFDTTLHINREKCTLCFLCVGKCPSTALSRLGTEMSVDEIVGKVTPYKSFFENSGGGVTLSGGEPTLFMEFTSSLLRRFKEEKIHTLLETNCCFDCDKFESLILPFVDMIYADIKIINPEEHKRWCGVENDRILRNFIRLHQQSRAGGFKILPRTPLIPEVTDTDANIRDIAGFYRDNGVKVAGIEKNNPLWFDKCEKIGIDTGFSDTSLVRDFYDSEKFERVKEFFLDRGVKTVEI
ncbi:MAG: glycyl-radical enzyme activating protein [Planctomycetes bacterium]|nr:glycyl-radical enzyme activating protein [Planctomycetota bacterium]